MGKSGDPRKRARAYRSDDPRSAGGDIEGIGDDPYARNSAVITTQNAVLLEGSKVAILRQEDGREAIAMALSGRINRSFKQSSVLYIFDEDGAAAIITELMALADRAGWGKRVTGAIRERQARLEALGQVGARSSLPDLLRPGPGHLGLVARSPARGDV